MSVDVLYLAQNRKAFTRITFELLLRNTNWDRVRRLVVYDDGSQDGTADYLRQNIDRCPAEHDLIAVDYYERYNSPVGIMLDYLAGDAGEWFTKIDNDVVLPEGWLDALVDTAAVAGDAIDLLGFEAGMTERPPETGEPRYEIREARHIGGVGLMRSGCFRAHHRPRPRGRHFGFTEWQHASDLRIGWLTPDLRSPLLDRMPTHPFVTLSDRYVGLGWQRVWPAYEPGYMEWAYGWLLEDEVMEQIEEDL